ncbi:MAG: hypothetical protein HY858_02865 [Candidatus Solibacter usitatus]|nr:hypothetical protein [Candidatus Solibacter usitatus]
MTQAGKLFLNGMYRGAAGLSAMVLGSSEIVESVFVHRSVATGEIAFGRSDIDLVAVVRQPEGGAADGAALLSLYQTVRQLRRVNPAVGHMAVQDPEGIRSEVDADTYLGSIDRRSALTLYGKHVDFPSLPVRRLDAVRRFAFWQDSRLATAVLRGDRRNQRKIAADMWNAKAVASGLLPVPFVTRAEAERHWMFSEEAGSAGEIRARPEQSPWHCFRMARQLHDQLLPPLRALEEPFQFRRKMAPRFRERAFLVMPGRTGGPAPKALEPCSFLTTPELLHLYVHFVNPFMDWILPAELRELGFQRPSPEAFARACLFYGHTHTTRNPGFMHAHVAAPAMILALLEYSCGYLQNGETPPVPVPERVESIGRRRVSLAGYYLREFSPIYQRTAAAGAEFRNLLNRQMAAVAS